MLDMSLMIDDYFQWLRQRTAWRQIGEGLEITTPYLDRHNDYLQIYLLPTADGYLLTDDGTILNDLAESGCRVDTPKRQGLLRMTLASYGVQQAGDELQVTTTREQFARNKHNLVQAMLAVNDLFYLAEPTVAAVFAEDVEQWLGEIGASFLTRFKLAGKSGYDHLFDFGLPAGHGRPERLLKVVNHLSKQAVTSAAFAWTDIRATRPEGSQAYVILNDSGSRLPANEIRALKAYDAVPVLWSERDGVREALAA